MQIPPEFLPVIQITLPIVAAIFGASWIQNKRLDDIRQDMREFRAEIRTELSGIREELKQHGERLTRLEERIPPLVHR